MIALLTLASVLTQAGGPISFTEAAAPLKRLMPRLAESCHVDLKVSKAMENDVVCIAVHDVSVKDLLAKVSATTGGKWVEMKDGIYLKPDPVARANLTADGLGKRGRRIQADLKELERLKEKPTAEADAFKRSLLKYENALATLFMDFADSVGVRNIAALPLEYRAVWSNASNACQLQLSPRVSQDVSDYVSARNGVNDAVKVRLVPPADGKDDFTLPWSQIILPVAKADLVLEVAGCRAGELAPEMRLELLLYDERGKLLGQESLLLDDGVHQTIRSEKRRSETENRQLELPTEMRELRNYFDLDNAKRTRIAQNSAFATLLRPDRFDPLDCPAALLRGLAKENDAQLVACLPDEAFRWFVPDNKIFTSGALVDYIASDPSVVLIEHEGWITVSPTRPNSPHIDRAAFTTLVHSFAGKTDFELADLITVATAGYGTVSGTFTNPWIECVCPALANLEQSESWKLLDACGSVEPKILESILEGHQLTFDELNPEARDAINSLYLGFVSRTQRLDYYVEPDQDGTAASLDFRTEPTEAAPNGLPSATVISVESKFETILRPTNIGKTLIEQEAQMTGLTPEDLGYLAAIQNWDPGRQELVSVDFDTERRLFKEVQVGERATYHLKIQLPNGVTLEGEIDVPTFSDRKTYTLSNLPPKIREQYEISAETRKQVAREMLLKKGDSQSPAP